MASHFDNSADKRSNSDFSEKIDALLLARMQITIDSFSIKS